ncbi:MAG: ABC transporter ATP-binding protein [Gemmatimonadales bacterium]
MARVVLERVRKVYEESGVTHVAVHAMDLLIADGEFLVLVGPSGCGKSTTLRMVAGLESVTDGIIRIGDRVVNEVPARDRDIAMVFQNYALYPHMTVYQNLGFALRLRREPKEVIDARVREAATLLGIETLLERKPRQLSGGQRQRVAVGRAIVRHPKVFLFDEPLSNLDAKLRVQMRRELAALHRRLGATTIYVTHDQVEAMTLGDRVVLMRDGVVQQVGPPLLVYQRPANLFTAAFLGNPPMNQLAGRVRRDGGLGFESEEGGFRISLPDEEGAAVLENREVVLGLRPESLLLSSEGSMSPGRFDALVEEIEPLGHELLVTVRAGGTTLVLRTDAGSPLALGQAVGCRVAPGGYHWFDAVTGERPAG